MDFLDNIGELSESTRTAIAEEIEKNYVPLSRQQELAGENQRLLDEAQQLREEVASLQKEAAARLKTEKLRHAFALQGVSDPDYLIYRKGGVENFSFDENGEPENLSSLCEDFRADPTLSHLFSRETYVPLRGGVVSVNPFAKETFNLTEQAKLFREDPAAAGLLAAEAGVAFAKGGKR